MCQRDTDKPVNTLHNNVFEKMTKMYIAMGNTETEDNMHVGNTKMLASTREENRKWGVKRLCGGSSV